MYKIGLITTSHAINYGAVLQAFSLKKAIEENTGATVDIINYCGDEEIAGRKIYRKNNNLKNVILNIFSIFGFKYRRNRMELFRTFDKFKAENLGITGELIIDFNKLKTINEYDAYICGSDQLWNLNLFDDPAFFLKFVKSGVKKVAYAVSISERMSDEQMRLIGDRVSDFAAISIREYDDAQRLSEIVSKRIYNLIDPVFLHTSKEWKKILTSSINKNEKYVFVFLISHQKTDQETINRIKKDRKVIVLNLHQISYVAGDAEINVCSPGEFLDYIYNADSVITDSFHCTAFSIIFNKLFYNIKRPTRNNRIENLYKKLSIDNRFCDSNRLPSDYIDYSKEGMKDE